MTSSLGTYFIRDEIYFCLGVVIYNRPYLVGFLRELNKLIDARYLEKLIAQCKHLANASCIVEVVTLFSAQGFWLYVHSGSLVVGCFLKILAETISLQRF
jgi:hypothetical protein